MTCKELGSHHHFHNKKKSWTNWRLVIFLRSVRKLRSQDKLQPWKLVMGIKRFTAKAQREKPPAEVSTGKNASACQWCVTRYSLKTSWRAENPLEAQSGASPHFQEDYPLPRASPECKKRIPSASLWERGKPYCEIYSELSLFYLTRPTLGKTILAEPKEVLPKADEPQWRKYSILAPSSLWWEGEGNT